MRGRWALLALGLGLTTGTTIPVPGAAQQVPRDTSRTRRDTLVTPVPIRRLDSLRVDSAAARDTTAATDTVKTPIAPAPVPISLDVGETYTWDREALFASGALTLLDLLERIPDITGYRTAFLLGPELAAYQGSFGRIRVFLDGIELDELDPRLAGQTDLSTLELWTLEQLTLERAAGELRVHARTWRVDRTVPNTRTDVSTGDLRTNVFRGFFGKRWSQGQLLQVGAQQFATVDPSGADGDQLSLFARVGWAAGEWSVDGFASTTSRLRRVVPRQLDDRPPLPPLDSRRDLYYLRAGYRNPDVAGPWVQLVAAIQRFSEASENPTTVPTLPVDTVDTLAQRSQFLASAGFTRGAARLGATMRVRAFDGDTYLSPGARAEWAQGIVAASAFVERAADDSTLRADVQLRVTPLPFVSLLGVASHHAPFGDDGRDSEQAFRAEAGVRVGRTWLSGGWMARGSALTPAPLAFDTGLAPVTREATGLFGQIRGPVWRDVSVAVTGVFWGDDDAGAGYVPRRQLRSEATLDTRWLSRFPSGNFGLRASLVHDWRDAVLFPLADGSRTAVPASSVLDGLLEIRILDGVIWLQARNMTAVTWASTPGFVQPATTLLYGVRWQFWN